jgi:hypothetical protein
MEHSHFVGVFVCGGVCMFVNYFLDKFLLDTMFQIMPVRNAS